jgi:hypothetical protein
LIQCPFYAELHSLPLRLRLRHVMSIAREIPPNILGIDLGTTSLGMLVLLQYKCA